LVGLSQFKYEGDPKVLEEIKNLQNKANSFFRTNLDSAEFYGLKALELARFKNLPSQKGYIYYTLSTIYDKKGETSKSFEYLDLVSMLAKELDDPRLQALVSFQRGNLYFRMGQFDFAANSVNNAIDNFEEAENQHGLSNAYEMIANIYGQQKDYSKQLEYFNKAIALNNKNKDESRVANNYANYSLMKYDLGQFDSSVWYMQKSISIQYKIHDTLRLMKSYSAIAGFYSQLNQFDSAYAYLGKAKKRLEGNSNPFLEIETKYIEAGIYFEKKDFRNSLKLFREIKSEAETVQYFDRNLTATKGIYESLKFLGNHEESLEYLEEYTELQDSLNSMIGKDKLRAMELENTFKLTEEKYKSENEKLQIEKSNEELKTANKNYLIVLLSIVFAVIVIFVLALLRRKIIKSKEEKKNREGLKKDLELKNKELISNAMRMMRKNEEINSSIDTLKRVRMGLNKNEQKDVGDVIKNLDRSLNIRSWEDFELSFRELYASFYDQLLNLFPDLTQTEIKVCSFLKLGLNSKQIAELMSKTSQSVEVDRSRIRKKMNLTNKKIGLQEYLMQEF
jgi:tetratricopeptide (TPR) repeat protein